MILNRKNAVKDTHSTKADSSNTNSMMLKLVTSYSIFLLAILILFFVIYQSTLNNMRDSYNIQNETTLANNVELFEIDLHIMEVYCRQLLQDKSFRKIMNIDNAHHPSFIEEGAKLKDTLSTDIYLETLLPIRDSYIFFPLTNYILNYSHFIGKHQYYEYIQKYPLESEHIWVSYHTDSKYNNRFIFLENFSSLPNSEYDFYLYTININDLFYLDANATASFIFDPEDLIQLFECLKDEEDGFLMVTDESGAPILTINENNIYDTNAILHSNYDNIVSSYDNGNNDLSIGRYVSENTGYIYYYSFSSFDKTANTGFLHFIFITSFLFVILAGSFLVFILARRNMRPYIEMGQELHEAVEAQTHLQEVVDNQRPIICRSYIRQLLSGTIASEEESSYICNYLGLKETSYYNVLYVVMYNNFEDSNGNLPEGLETPEELQEIIMGALKDFLGEPLYYFSPSDRTYSILLPYDVKTEKDFIIKINNIILKIHEFMLDTYDIWLFAGIGQSTDSLMNVWESYQQAQEAVNYTTKNYIFYPYEFIKKNSNAFYYPMELSTKLIHFITTGNTAQVLELFNLIHRENIEERSLPINLLKYLLSDIRNTLLKARFALPSDTDADTVRLIDERFDEHPSFKLCEDIALSLCKLFVNDSNDSSLIATIEKYIAKNYQDPSLGLNKISDEFQISESYFSHMFKEKTGVNFSTYLENIRMAEAARLIKESDISLNELYIAVGYNNSNSFRRAFKKVYGVTPSSLRETK